MPLIKGVGHPRNCVSLLSEYRSHLFGLLPFANKAHPDVGPFDIRLGVTTIGQSDVCFPSFSRTAADDFCGSCIRAVTLRRVIDFGRKHCSRFKY